MPNSPIAKYTGWVAIGIAVLFVVLGFYGYANYAKFHARVEALKKAGEPISVSDFTVKVAPEDDLLTPLTEFKDEIIEFGSQCPREWFAREELSDKEVELFESLVEKHPNVFAAIDEACERSEMSFDPLLKQEFKAVDLVKVLVLLGWKAGVRRFEGQHEEAAKIALQMLSLSGELDAATLLTSSLSRAFQNVAINLVSEMVADEAKSGKAISKELKDEIANQLRGFETLQDFQTVVKAERARMIHMLINPELYEPEDGYEHSHIASVIFKVKGGGAATWGNAILDQFETMSKLSEAPLSAELDSEIVPQPNMLLRAIGMDVGFAWTSIRDNYGESVIRQRALVILLALTQDGKASDRTDWSTDYLVGIGVPEEMTVDPYNDKPLIIRRIEGMWRIYSVGPNRVDDSGTVSVDYGLGLLVEEED